MTVARGAFAWRSTVVPIDRVQSWSTTQSPLQRRHDLHDVVIHVSGARTVSVLDVSTGAARRAARGRQPIRRWPPDIGDGVRRPAGRWSGEWGSTPGRRGTRALVFHADGDPGPGGSPREGGHRHGLAACSTTAPTSAPRCANECCARWRKSATRRAAKRRLGQGRRGGSHRCPGHLLRRAVGVPAPARHRRPTAAARLRGGVVQRRRAGPGAGTTHGNSHLRARRADRRSRCRSATATASGSRRRRSRPCWSTRPHRSLPSVGIDDRLGGHMATQHLIDLGHTPHRVRRRAAQQPVRVRRQRPPRGGLPPALERAGIEPVAELVRYGAHLRSAAKQMTLDLLSIDDPPTAIVATSDVQAVGVLEAAASLGRRVPDDLSVDRLRRHRARLADEPHDGPPAARGLGRRGADLVLEAIAVRAPVRSSNEELQIELSCAPRPAPGDEPGRPARSAHRHRHAVVARRRRVPGVRPVVRRRRRRRGRRPRRHRRPARPPRGARRRRRLAHARAIPSPQLDHGYDVADYFGIEPMYGDLADVRPADRGGASPLDPGADGRGAQPLQLGSPLVPGGARRRPGQPRACSLLLPRRPRSERRPAAEQLAIGVRWRRPGPGSPRPTAPPVSGTCTRSRRGSPTSTGRAPDVIAHVRSRCCTFWFDRGVEGFRVDAVAVVGKAAGSARRTAAVPEGTAENDAGSHNPYTVFWPTAHDHWRGWRTLIEQLRGAPIPVVNW